MVEVDLPPAEPVGHFEPLSGEALSPELVLVDPLLAGRARADLGLRRERWEAPPRPRSLEPRAERRSLGRSVLVSLAVMLPLCLLAATAWVDATERPYFEPAAKPAARAAAPAASPTATAGRRPPGKRPSPRPAFPPPSRIKAPDGPQPPGRPQPRTVEPRPSSPPRVRPLPAPQAAPRQGRAAPKVSAPVLRRAPAALRWRRAERAGYYNVQVYLGRSKVLELWPSQARARLPGAAFPRGRYRWYAWPGYGDRRAARYGPRLSSGTFVVSRAPARKAVRAPQRLAWPPAAGATYYNVQLLRGREKLFEAWPRTASVRLPPRWRFAGRAHQLEPGAYDLYVWPGYGARARARYGSLLTRRSLVVA